ncbi:hypothetical protein ACJMK2_011304 [Sinanodonta woodiana]|uniref:G-protein coupled receptors family 3 profile domain-containing protein n=1 Tax=Sinanodonta woodiana TaxID=1069815 RepID=A0ABD3V4K1_SINWO
MRILVPAFIIVLFGFGNTLSQSMRSQTCDRSFQGAVIQPDADAFIGGLFQIHVADGTGYGCGKINSGEMQSYEAVRWAIDRLNKKNEILNGQYLNDTYIPGVKIGMIVRDYCEHTSTAISAALDLFPQFQAGSSECVKDPTKLMLGKIMWSSKINIWYTAIVELLKQLGWSYITIVYTDDTYGSEAYRTIRPLLAGANICLTAAIETAAEDVTSGKIDGVLNDVLATSTVGVIYLGNRDVGHALLDRGSSVSGAGRLQWIFTDSISLSEKFPNMKYPRGLIVVVPGARSITEFEDHWVRINPNNPSPQNPWYKDMYMEINQCKLAGIQAGSYYSGLPNCTLLSEDQRRSIFVQDEFVEPAVHAVYTYARALREAHLALCGGFPGFCDSLRQLSTKNFYLKYMRNIDFIYEAPERVESLAAYNLQPYNAPARVKFNGNDIISPSYDVYNFNDYKASNSFTFEKLGTFLAGRLEIVSSKLRFYSTDRTRIVATPISQCPTNPCYPCLGATVTSKYMYIPGDIVVAGLFSLHHPGSEALTCGNWNEDPDSGMQYMEALSYAVDYINNVQRARDGILNGVKLGGLAFDDCQNSVLGAHQLTEVQRNAVTITDINGLNKLDPRTVEAFVGASSSYLTVGVATLMNEIKKPLVAYAAEATSFDNEEVYPYFLRSHYSDEEFAKAFVLFLKRMGWMYAQSLYYPGEFGNTSNEVLRQVAAENGICIVASYQMGIMPLENIVMKLRERADVHPLIIIGDHYLYRSFFAALKSTGGTGNFKIITAYGNYLKTVAGYEDMLNGMVSVKLMTPAEASSTQEVRLVGFRDHLRSLDARTYKLNPWFTEWYEWFYNCSLDANNLRGFSTVCTNQNRPINDAPGFEMTERVISLIYGMRAIAVGLDSALKYYCGTNYRGVCGAFLNAKDKGTLIRNQIKQATFSSEIGQYRFYKNDGNIPFEYYNFRIDTNSFKSVGTYKPADDTLTVDTSALRLYGGVSPTSVSSRCDTVCLDCLYMFRYQEFMYVPGDLLIPAVFDVHYKGNSPFACGKLRTVNGFLYSEVFRFALNLINSGSASVKLNNVSLGGLGFDGCSDKTRASTLVLGIHSGAFPRSDMILGQTDISLNDLQGWLSYDSESTINIATILRQFGIPLITPGATSPVLNDKTRFSTFFRTVPSETMVAKAMALLARRLGFDYIITLNAPEEGSRSSLMEFRKYANESGICIGASYEFETDGSVDQIMRYVNQSTTKVVAVFTDPDQYVRELLDVKAKTPAVSDLVFIANRPWTVQAKQYAGAAKNAITFKMNTNNNVIQFQQFLEQQIPDVDHPNPWLRDFYQAIYRCNLGGSIMYSSPCIGPSAFRLSSDVVPDDIRTLSTMNAVYALAEGIHRTLKELCGPNYSGVCPQFTSAGITVYQKIMKHMDALNFTDIDNAVFQFIEREANIGLVFSRFDGSGVETQEGTYTRDGVLKFVEERLLVQTYQNTSASCIGDCQQCDAKGIGDVQFQYIEGDILIGALFDIHKAGSTPYTCGVINGKYGYQLVEAFNWAIDLVNSKQGMFSNILNGVTLGAILLDVCQSPTLAGNLVANIHSGNVQLSSGGYPVNPTRFDLYIGPLESESSIRVADVLNKLGIPQISYGATTLELQDATKYPYFLRTVPADDKQARALISFLKRFELFNIQLVSQYSSVGILGRKEFLRLAELNKICVSEDIVIGYTGQISDLEAMMAVNRFLKHNNSLVVVMIMDDPYPILRAAEKNNLVREKYFFIGTDKWGFDYDNLKGIDGIVKSRRALTLDIETADFPELDKYLEDKNPDNYDRNPWFEEYYQYIYNCSWNGQSQYPTTCSPDLIGYSRASNYIQDPYVLYVVNSVFSAAFGVHKALQSLCGTNYYYVCNLFRNSGERRQLILRNIQKVSFTDQTLQPFYFTPAGESDRGYHIYQPLLDETGTGYYWEDVGSYNDTHYLKIDAEYTPNWVSNCDKPGSCVCVFPAYQPSRYMLKKSSNDLNIVYVSDIHFRDPNNIFGCGAIDTASGFQNLLAFFYAIELVNNNTVQKFPSSLKLGGLALDSCSAPMRIGQDVYSLLSGEPICSTDNNEQPVPPATLVSFLAENSANAIAVSSMVSNLGITSMSQSATSVELSDKLVHSKFLRTVPPDNVQAIVMAKMLKRFGWNYASAIYSDDSYGRAAIQTLLEEADKADSVTCIGTKIKMTSDATLNDAKDIIDQLNKQIGASVVLLFVTPSHARLLLQAATETGATHRFTWLGSDTWANNEIITDGYEEAASGALTIQIASETVNSFKNYVKKLSLKNRMGIPNDWFEELYQTLFQCRIQESIVKKPYTQICTGQEQITDDMIPQDPYVFHTILSVFLVAQGLSDIEVCKKPGLDIAACLSVQANRLDLIYGGISQAQYKVLPDELGNKSFLFKFTEAGYGDVGYNILNYRRNFSSGSYEYIKIGSYQQDLLINSQLYYSYSTFDNSVPVSQCPVGSDCPCLRSDGSVRIFSRRGSGVSYYVNAEGQYVDPNTGLLVTIQSTPQVGDRFNNIWGIIVATLAGVGAFVSLCLFIYLLIVYPIRSGTSILGYMLSFGIILVFALTFAFIVHASDEVCALRRFCLALVYSIVYSSLFIKVVDCYRTRDREDVYSVKYKKIGNPCGLFLVALLMVGVQIMINAEWLILEEPNVERVLYNNMLWPRCTPDDFYDEGLVLSNVYIFVLIFLTIIFGLCAWKSEKNNNECKWILGSVILTVPCWMTWCLVATLGEYKMRDAAVAIALVFNGYVFLLCGPLRKLYLLNKYQKTVEEDEKSIHAFSSQKDYNSMYGMQYDNNPQLHDRDSALYEPH